MKHWFKKYFNYCFIVCAVLELVATGYHPPIRVITKPLLLLLLITYYLLSSIYVDWVFSLALFFAFLGDTLLLWSEYFLFGLGAFLIMQLLYAYCFLKQRGTWTNYKILGVMGVVVATGTILYLLIPDLGSNMKEPVIVYSASISLMAIAAIIRQYKGKDYWMILLGVISFLISDSILGLNKFGAGFELADFLVMLTYIIAQYLIVQGYLRYEKGNNASFQT